MIVTLPDTTTQQVDAELLALREQGGVVALGRVLTLIIYTHGPTDEIISAANAASREHPCRIIVLTPVPQSGSISGVDAEIRVGADAGASEVILLSPKGEARQDLDTLITPLLLPDAPIVAWWPNSSPKDLACSALGQLAQRRISDISSLPDPPSHVQQLNKYYAPGDTDLSWARTTPWRGLIATTLETFPHSPESVHIEGNFQHPALMFLAGWLAAKLDIAITITNTPTAENITTIAFETRDGPILLNRSPGSDVLRISAPDQPSHHVPLPIRGVQESLVEDLRRLDPDTTYREALAAACSLEVS